MSVRFDAALCDDKTRQAWARFAPSTTGILRERPEAGRHIMLYESLKERVPKERTVFGFRQHGASPTLANWPLWAKQEERRPDSWYHLALDSEVEWHKEFHGYLHRPTNVAAAD